MRIRPELKGALLTLIFIALVLLGVWIHNGLRLGVWTYNQFDRYLWLTENMGVARELWHGNIKAGDDAEQFVKIWHPDSVTHFNHWIRMDWYPGGIRKDAISLIGITVVAHDEVLVQATSWSDDGLDGRVFFNTLSSETQSEFRKAFEEYVKALVEKRKSVNSTNDVTRP
jgi:hypothetical protein